MVWGACGGLAFTLLPSACLTAGAQMAPFLTVPPLAAALLAALLFALGAAAGAAICAARRASAAGRPLLAWLASRRRSSPLRPPYTRRPIRYARGVACLLPHAFAAAERLERRWLPSPPED